MNHSYSLSERFWKFIYNALLVPISWIIFHLFGLVDRKAARALRGRRNLWKKLERDLSALDSTSHRIWLHSSSLGEFEQAKPIIQELKRRYPGVKVIASFFSPSGYDHSQTFKYVDVITYLPFDSAQNAEKFINLIQPAAAVFIRYDVWPNHLWHLRRAGIPTFIVNATLRANGVHRFPIIRSFYRAIYNSLDHILMVSDDDKRRFQSLGLNHPSLDVVGDTRYDQVLQRSTESRKRQVLAPRIVADRKILLIGSSWEEDERVLLPVCLQLQQTQSDLLVILVPHEPTLETLERIENTLNSHAPSIRFSQLGQYDGERFVLIDSVGILMALYQYAHVAYVGGGFGSGLHNVLEPAVYGIPVLVGPAHDNSQEAVELIREGGAFAGKSEEEFLDRLLLLLSDDASRKFAGGKALALVKRNAGATGRFLEYLESVFEFRNT